MFSQDVKMLKSNVVYKKKKIDPLSNESMKIFMWVNKHCSSFYKLVCTHHLRFLYESKQILNIISTIFKQENRFVHL